MPTATFGLTSCASYSTGRYSECARMCRDGERMRDDRYLYPYHLTTRGPQTIENRVFSSKKSGFLYLKTFVFHGFEGPWYRHLLAMLDI